MGFAPHDISTLPLTFVHSLNYVSHCRIHHHSLDVLYTHVVCMFCSNSTKRWRTQRRSIAQDSVRKMLGRRLLCASICSSWACSSEGSSGPSIVIMVSGEPLFLYSSLLLFASPILPLLLTPSILPQHIIDGTFVLIHSRHIALEQGERLRSFSFVISQGKQKPWALRGRSSATPSERGWVL